MILFNALGALL